MLLNLRMLTRVLLIPVMFVAVVARSGAHGDTTVPISGIGTSYNGDVPIDTHVDSVTYSRSDVMFEGIPAVEIRGTVSGTGWGGTGLLPRSANAHYHYDIPFVARWRKHNNCPRLVFFHHGGGVMLMPAILRDKAAGALNPNRSSERNGDMLVGLPTLLDGATYISINRRGLRGDGTFCATYVDPMEPLNAMELIPILAAINGAPGPAGFVQPGLTAGAQPPALPTNDAATCRDIARALEHVVAGIQGRPFRTRIAVGTSSGARVLAAINFGRSVLVTTGVRTGGNHVLPYDTTSPRIFDGFILSGFPYIPDVDHADQTMPFSAPVMFVQGQGDERYQQHVTMAAELLRRGVELKGRVWIYEIKNLTHVTRDVPAEVSPTSDGDRLGCFLSAAIRNLRCCLEEGRSPPMSRMTGRIVAGALTFDQANGTTTDFAPVKNDEDLDAIQFDTMLVKRTMGPAEKTRWLAVTAALPHVTDAITPPTVACRLGGYKLKFFGSDLTPRPPADLIATYGSFERYRERICRVVSCLERERLYDSRVESACQTAERARALFGEDSY